MKYKFLKKTERIDGIKDKMMVLCMNPRTKRLSCVYRYNSGWSKIWEEPPNKIIREKGTTLYYVFKEVK